LTCDYEEGLVFVFALSFSSPLFVAPELTSEPGHVICLQEGSFLSRAGLVKCGKKKEKKKTFFHPYSRIFLFENFPQSRKFSNFFFFLSPFQNHHHCSEIKAVLNTTGQPTGPSDFPTTMGLTVTLQTQAPSLDEGLCPRFLKVRMKIRVNRREKSPPCNHPRCSFMKKGGTPQLTGTTYPFCD